MQRPSLVRSSGNLRGSFTEYAENQDIDHIVIGCHGRSIVSRVLLGDVAQTVAQRASVPVTFVR
nr:universal stress protein [Halogeometricum borinquense]